MSTLPPRPHGVSRRQWRAHQFAGVNQGYDLTRSEFVQAGVKAESPYIVIRPTTPRRDRIEAKLFGAPHGFKGPPPRRQSRGVARWDGCRESRIGASFYANKNRIREQQAQKPTVADPGQTAVARVFRYLQNSNLDVVGIFERMDTDGSGELDQQEFRAALLQMGLGLSDDEMGLVMREIDTDGGGTISIDEFSQRMHKLDRRMAAGGQGTLQDTLDRIFDYVDANRFRIVDMFNKIDTDGNGELDAVEFSTCMMQLGLELTEYEVGLIISELDTDAGGTIGIDEFMDQMRQIHRKRRKAAKNERNRLARSSEYERKREKSRYAVNPTAHPAVEALGEEGIINFTASEEFEPVTTFPRRWRPSSAERFEPSHMAFASSYHPAGHSAFTYEDRTTGQRRDRSLPALNTTLTYHRSISGPRPRSGGRIDLNSSSLGYTSIDGVRHKFIAQHERARWNSPEATRAAEHARMRARSALASHEPIDVIVAPRSRSSLAVL